MVERSLEAWRREYTAAGLFETDLAGQPDVQLARWLAEARAAGLHEPNAMVLSTVGPEARPSSRMVLLKGLDAGGLVFYTNYDSRKSRELAANPPCCLLFPWEPLQRQVRVEGVARRLDASVSDRYFATRPRGAQVGAWASPQSSVVPGRDALEAAYTEAEARWRPTEPVPRPDDWGGFVVDPDAVEFWQGRADRMHDRLRYRRSGEAGGWTVERLAP
ncbi:MAG TPA: pyridoxamine 5'-phosphate oxidase [Nocardioidaceae bacterium]|nr:pyridoxamine 5'-phosphate oxidase [Nocardioidaceae bacterium]